MGVHGQENTFQENRWKIAAEIIRVVISKKGKKRLRFLYERQQAVILRRERAPYHRFQSYVKGRCYHQIATYRTSIKAALCGTTSRFQLGRYRLFFLFLLCSHKSKNTTASATATPLAIIMIIKKKPQQW